MWPENLLTVYYEAELEQQGCHQPLVSSALLDKRTDIIPMSWWSPTRGKRKTTWISIFHVARYMILFLIAKMYLLADNLSVVCEQNNEGTIIN